MEAISELRVSIDVGCYHHSVAVSLLNGVLLEEFELAHDQEGLERFFAHRPDPAASWVEAPVAMEGYNGWARPCSPSVPDGQIVVIA